MARKFQLRNGWAVKEVESSDVDPGEYSNRYATLEEMEIRGEVLPINTLVVLITNPNGSFPLGGAHGADFDIVEEL